jgi:hypothetical protein
MRMKRKLKSTAARKIGFVNIQALLAGSVHQGRTSALRSEFEISLSRQRQGTPTFQTLHPAWNLPALAKAQRDSAHRRGAMRL